MSIQKIYQSSCDVTHFDRQNNLLNKLPAELLLRCLSKLDLRSLFNFSQVSKKCYVATFNPNLWATVAAALNFKIPCPVDKAMCQKGYQLKKQCDNIINGVFKLNEKLGKDICQKIDSMPVWSGTIQYNEDKAFLKLSQFAEQPVWDEQNHFFKTVMDDDLYLILITSNRLVSSVIRFNSAFKINSMHEKEYLYWQYGVGESSMYEILMSECWEKKQFECQSGWASMKSRLCNILDVKFTATNLPEIGLEALSRWIDSHWEH